MFNDVVHPALMNLTGPVPAGTITAQMAPTPPPPPQAPPAGAAPMDLDAFRAALAALGAAAAPTTTLTRPPVASSFVTGKDLLQPPLALPEEMPLAGLAQLEAPPLNTAQRAQVPPTR